MIDIAHAALLAGHRDFPRHDDPAAGRFGIHLIAAEQLRMLLEIPLENVLGVVRARGHFDKIAVT